MNPALPAAASVLLRPLLGRPARPGPIVTASRTAVHVATGDPDVPVLSLVGPGAAQLPGACVLAGADAGPVLARFGSAAHLLVGDGTVASGELAVDVRRWWVQPAVRMPDGWPALRDGADALAVASRQSGRAQPATVADSVDRLAASLGAGDDVSATRAVHAMVGLGPGLTPAADDVLAGALLTWRHLELAGWPIAGAAAEVVSAAVIERLDRTTAVSAALLHHANRGCSLPEALRLLDTLRAPAAIAGALAALTRIGHDTGGSIARGVDLAVGAVLGVRRTERVAR